MNSEIGLRLLKLREMKKKSQEEVADEIEGATQSIVSRHERGVTTPGRAWLEKYAAYYGVTVDYLLGRDETSTPGTPPSILPATAQPRVEPEAAYEAGVTLPILGEVRAGPNHLAFQEVIGRAGVEAERVAHDLLNYFWLRVRGDSMVMEGIVDGGLVLIHRQPDVDDGEIALVSLDEEEATIKRIRRVDGSLILIPANPAYRERIVPANEATIIGRVEYVTRDMKRN